MPRRAKADQAAKPRRRIVMVLGMHRSGTSLCGNVLHELGVDIAETAGPSAANQRGHWERPRINDLHDAILGLFGRGWESPAHHLALPEGWAEDERVAPIRQRLVSYLTASMSSDRHYGFKDPRTSRLLEMWTPLLAALELDPVTIFCVRAPAQVARSVTARDGLDSDQAAYRWLVYNAQAVAGIGTSRVCVIPYESWFTAPDATLDRLTRFVGLPPRPELVSVIDGALRHDALDGGAPVARVAGRLHRGIAESGEHFGAGLVDLAETILDCERAVMPFLRDAALLPLSVAEQNRVIADLQGLVGRLRGK